jgi:hypothetical protein
VTQDPGDGWRGFGWRNQGNDMLRSSALTIALLLGASQACATGDFVCVADTAHGPVVFGDAADSSDGEPLEPPVGTPFLRVGESAVDVSRTNLRRERGGFSLRDLEIKQTIFSMHRVSGAPDIPTAARHPFCDVENWRESCWSAKLTFRFQGRTVTVERALCGVG